MGEPVVLTSASKEPLAADPEAEAMQKLKRTLLRIAELEEQASHWTEVADRARRKRRECGRLLTEARRELEELVG